MKKYLVLALVCSLGLNLYLVNVEYVVQDDFEKDYDQLPEQKINDQVTIAQSALQKKNQNNCQCDCNKINANKNMIVKDEIIAERKDQLSEEVIREKIEQGNQQWLENSENFFMDDLRLSPDQIARYRDLNIQRQNEISKYFEQKTKVNGDDSPETYLFTSEDTIFMGKLAEKYEKMLKDNFGDENYQRHREFIKKHNNKLKTDEFVQLIEF